MRPVALMAPNGRDQRAFNAWVQEALREIERASYDEPESAATAAQDFTVSNYTETLTLDASTALLTDVVNVVCTLIDRMKAAGG